jgi:multisubunit Na+/H+ antiporter MnhG subunit
LTISTKLYHSKSERTEMELLLIALIMVLGAAFAATAVANGADSREMYADSHDLPHGVGLN